MARAWIYRTDEGGGREGRWQLTILKIRLSFHVRIIAIRKFKYEGSGRFGAMVKVTKRFQTKLFDTCQAFGRRKTD
jgi:hypothetical protein